MKKSALALTALVMTTGVSFAMPNSIIVTAHDAAPASVVVNPPANIDYTGMAGFGATSTGVLQTARDAAPPSVVVNPPANIDYSSSAGMSAPSSASPQAHRAWIIQERADNR
jgi:hypothetical protein